MPPIPSAADDEITEVIKRFNVAKRPLLMIGNGVRLAGAKEEIEQLKELLQAPTQTSWNALDMVAAYDPLYFGRPSIVANRAENIILQRADFVLSVGARMGLLTTGFDFEGFLANADFVMVDIDKAELNKKNLRPQVKICADAKDFLKKLLSRKDELKPQNYSEWLRYCRDISEKYPPKIKEQEPREGFVSNYSLIEEISNQLTGNDIYQFTSSGTTVDIAMKMFRVKQNQRAFLTKALASMGYDIPASIGSAIASGRRVACLTGDGSAAMNMQELEVTARLKLPVKLFISYNNGYAMIYGSQSGNFKGRLSGCNKESGLTLPNMEKIAAAFGIRTVTVNDEKDIRIKVAET